MKVELNITCVLELKDADALEKFLQAIKPFLKTIRTDTINDVIDLSDLKSAKVDLFDF